MDTAGSHQIRDAHPNRIARPLLILFHLRLQQYDCQVVCGSGDGGGFGCLPPCTGSTCTARTMKNAAAAKIAKKRSRSTSEEQGRRGASIFILLLCAGRPALSISMLSVFRGGVQCSQPWCLALQFVGRGGASGGCFHQVKSG